MNESGKIFTLKPAIIILALLIRTIALSQEHPKKTSYGNQQWLQYYNKLKLSEKYTLVSDASLRLKDYFASYNQALLRTGIMYNFRENISVTCGIASTVSFNANKMNRGELRGWQELFLSSRISRLYLNNRFRLEERYFKNITNDNFDNGYNFNYRFRYRFFVSIPINNSTIKEKTLSVNMGDEIFINFGKEIIYNTFDNNRILLGINYHFNNKQFITLNYVNQLTHTKALNTYEKTDILWLSFTHTLGLKEKSKEK